MSALHCPDNSAPNSKEFTLHMSREDKDLGVNIWTVLYSLPLSFSAGAHQLHIYIRQIWCFLRDSNTAQRGGGGGSK